MTTLRGALDLVSTAPSSASRAVFAGAIDHSTLLVPVTRDSRSDFLKLLIVRNPKDRPLMVAFTDVAALRAWSAPDRPYLEMRARMFFVAASRAGVDAVYVDPRSPHGVRIPREDIVALVEGIESNAQGQGVGTFYVPPGPQHVAALSEGEFASVVDTVRRISHELHYVQEAFVMQWTIGDGEPHPLVGIRFIEATGTAERDAAFARLRDALARLIRRGEYVDFMDFSDPYAATLRGSGIRPAYSR